MESKKGDYREAQTLRDKRIPESQAFKLPESWCDSRFARFDLGKLYSVKNPVRIAGISTFGNNPMEIQVSQQSSAVPSFGRMEGKIRPAIANSVSQGKNNIRIGDISIIEHALSLTPGIGLAADYRLDAESFPSFNRGILELLEQVEPQIIYTGEALFTTVKEPLVYQFKNGGYVIFEPDDGSHKLIIDHQVSHPHNAIGKQRVIFEVKPETFAYIAEARTISYGIRTEISKILNKITGLSRLPFTSLGLENVVFAERNEFLNSNPKFDYYGKNWEALMHEVIDKLAPIGMLPGRFVGRVTTFLTNHAKDIEAAGSLIKDNLLINES